MNNLKVRIVGESASFGPKHFAINDKQALY